MKEFIKNIDSCYNQIDYKPLSNITKATISISLKYINWLKAKGSSHMLYIGLPFKGYVSLFLSAGLLKNFFNEDYILHSDEHFKNLNLKDGDRIKIFGLQTTWHKAKDRKNGTVDFSQKVSTQFGNKTVITKIAVKKSWLPYINNDNNNKARTTSLKKLNQILAESRKIQKPIDKFLNYSENGYGIPIASLNSKIILVTGRGKKAKTIDKLKEVKVYGTSLYDMLVRNNGLEILPDLKKYLGLFDNNTSNDLVSFINYARQILKKSQGFDSAKLLELLQIQDIYSQEFEDELDDLEQFSLENENELVINHIQSLRNGKPLESFDIPPSLKCIIIDNNEILIDYQNTIKGLLSKGVPIIHISSFQDDDFKINNEEDSYRFFFSKNKINQLCYNEKEVLDIEIQQRNKNYVCQKVNVELFDDYGIENIISSLSRQLYYLEGFENLRKLFWKEVYPSYFLFKNSPQQSAEIFHERIKDFYQTADELSNQLTPQIASLIEQLRTYNHNNSKEIRNKRLKGFNQAIPVINTIQNLDFKDNLISKTKISSNFQELTFTGRPYKEDSQNNINKALFNYFVPKVNMLFFPKEFREQKYSTEKFLTSKFFTDNVTFCDDINKKSLLIDRGENEEIKSIFVSKDNEEKNEVLDFETDEFHKKYTFEKHLSYQSKEEGDYNLECKVLYFSNDNWMYVPKQGKLYVAREYENEGIKIASLQLNQFQKNDIVVLYDLDVSQLTHLASNNVPLQESLKVLNIWRNIVSENVLNKSYESFSKELMKIANEEKNGANPSIQNLRNWVLDLDLISPREDNLGLILRYADRANEIANSLRARNMVISFRNQVRNKIKKQLINKLPKFLLNQDPNGSFSVSIYGLDLAIHVREISSLGKENITISYNNTKKIFVD